MDDTGEFAEISHPCCPARALLEHLAPQPAPEPQVPASVPHQPLWEQPDDWGDGNGGGGEEGSGQEQLLGAHEVASLVYVSPDGREGVFLRPYVQQQLYERQQFGLAVLRYVAFSRGETLVSFCKAPPGRCPNSTGLEPIFSGKNYPHSRGGAGRGADHVLLHLGAAGSLARR